MRFLILEDNPSDVEMILHELRKSGYRPNCTIVSSKDDYVRQLSDDVDIILSDYTMPQFDAQHALRILQQTGLDIPFIVISGTIGEDVAVAIMREGAADYLLKDRLSRLGPVLESAIKVKEYRERSRRAEETLKKLFRAVEQSADSIIVTDRNGIMEFVNPTVMRTTGYSKEELLGNTPAMLKSGKHPRVFYEDLWRTITAGRVFRAEFINRRKNGELYFELQSISPVFDDNGSIIHFVSTGREITEQRKMEEALRNSELRYRTLVESALDAIFTLDYEGRFTSLNTAFERITGWKREDWIGRGFLEMIHADDRAESKENFKLVLLGVTVPIREYRISTAAGSYVVVEVLTAAKQYDGAIVGVFGIARDVTERKRLELQLRQSQKMESVGTLAGGVAHDFNNILGIILGYIEQYQRKALNPDQLSANFEMMKQAVQRGAMLVRQILTFARKNDVVTAPVLVNDIIREAVKMLEQTIPRNIAIETRLDDVPVILMDPDQLHQALINLCINARDAILERMKAGIQSGTITLTSGVIPHVRLSERFPDIIPGDYVAITVSDNGIGMDKSTIQRIFDPFFTTKEVGKGTGLGLSVVYGAVRSHRGVIDVDSTPNIGTTFSIMFPVAEGLVVAPLPVAGEKIISTKGSETILIIEDEVSLSELLKIVLEDNGYTVLQAFNGKEGVEIFEKNKKKIHLVISDVGLPFIDGIQVMKTIKEQQPTVRAILASGFLEPEQRANIGAIGKIDVIAKPYESDMLLVKIRTVLDETIPPLPPAKTVAEGL